MRVKMNHKKHEYKLKSVMDLSSKSYNFGNTPSLRAQQLPFFLESCGHFFANKGYFTEREGLGNYLLLYTLQGSGKIRSKDNEILISKNCAVLIDCLEFQQYRTEGESIWEFMWIHLNGTAAPLYYDILNENGLSLVHIDEASGMYDLIAGIFDELDKKSRMLDLQLSEQITSIMTKVLLAKQETMLMPKYEQHRNDITQSLSIIKEHYQQQLTLDELSKNSHISKFYFIRIFKSVTGQTPYEYLMSFRINESKSLLTRTGFPISDIANMCGFTDTSNFIRCFKRATGRTPNAYRKDVGFLL